MEAECGKPAHMQLIYNNIIIKTCFIYKTTQSLTWETHVFEKTINVMPSLHNLRLCHTTTLLVEGLEIESYNYVVINATIKRREPMQPKHQIKGRALIILEKQRIAEVMSHNPESSSYNKDEQYKNTTTVSTISSSSINQ